MEDKCVVWEEEESGGRGGEAGKKREWVGKVGMWRREQAGGDPILEYRNFQSAVSE